MLYEAVVDRMGEGEGEQQAFEMEMCARRELEAREKEPARGAREKQRRGEAEVRRASLAKARRYDG